MARKGYSQEGFFGQIVHYDEKGHKTGESWPGLLGGYTDYDAKGHKVGTSSEQIFGNGYTHYDNKGHKTGSSSESLFGGYNNFDAKGQFTGHTDRSILDVDEDAMGRTGSMYRKSYEPPRGMPLPDDQAPSGDAAGTPEESSPRPVPPAGDAAQESTEASPAEDAPRDESIEGREDALVPGPEAAGTEREEPAGDIAVLRERTRLLAVIAILLGAIVVMLSILLMLSQRRGAASEDDTASQEAVLVSATIAPGGNTSAAASSVNKSVLTDSETYLQIETILDELMDSSTYLSDYNERFWLPDAVEVDILDIQREEQVWSAYCVELEALLAKMEAATPSALFKSSWDYLYMYISHFYEAAAILSDWDLNDDGLYSDAEVTAVNQNALDAVLEAKEDLNEMDPVYSSAIGIYETQQIAAATVTPTAKSVTSQKSSTSTSKSTTNDDPLNAKAYFNAEDFYYDNYDDFFDYEDAEDYWEEWD